MEEKRSVSYAYEQNYVALLHRDLIKESLDFFPENEGVTLEVQIMSGKRVDLVLKYGDKLIGIEMKVWPPFNQGYKKATSYSKYFDMTYLAVPLDYVQDAVRIKGSYPEIGLISVSLNTRSAIMFPAELSERTHKAKEDILFDYFWYDVTGLDDTELETYYRKKVWLGLERLFDRRVTVFNTYLALSALAEVYSPIKYFDYYGKLTSSFKELTKAEKKKWPYARSLQFLGVVEVYQWGPLKWKEAYFRINPFAFVALRGKFRAYLKQRQVYGFYKEWIRKREKNAEKTQKQFLRRLEHKF